MWGTRVMSLMARSCAWFALSAAKRRKDGGPLFPSCGERAKVIIDHRFVHYYQIHDDLLYEAGSGSHFAVLQSTDKFLCVVLHVTTAVVVFLLLDSYTPSCASSHADGALVVLLDRPAHSFPPHVSARNSMVGLGRNRVVPVSRQPDRNTFEYMVSPAALIGVLVAAYSFPSVVVHWVCPTSMDWRLTTPAFCLLRLMLQAIYDWVPSYLHLQ